LARRHRERVVWADAPAGTAVSAVTPSFTIGLPFVTLTTPNGGQTWTSGTSASVKWASNLGSLESVRLELSLDGGTSWGTVLSSATPSDGAHTINVSTAWAGTNAKVRIVWVKNASSNDASDAVFTIR
jgi:hypothetical protein